MARSVARLGVLGRMAEPVHDDESECGEDVLAGWNEARKSNDHAELHVNQTMNEQPYQCAIHTDQLDTVCRDVRDIKIAVCGDERIGIHGLVKDVEDLKAWRRRLDLRVAGIAGFISALVSILKYLMSV